MIVYITLLQSKPQYCVILPSHHEILKNYLLPSHDSKIFVLQFVFGIEPRTRKTMENFKDNETSTNKSGDLSYSNDLWASYKVRIL